MEWVSIKRDGPPSGNMIGKKVLCWLHDRNEPACCKYNGSGYFIETVETDIYNQNHDVITHWCMINEPQQA